MQTYDVALKLLLQGSSELAIRDITGVSVKTWLNVELPELRNTRVDLLGESAGGDLVHIELQSTNDATMPLRMAEYYLRVYRLFGRFPKQLLLYVGSAPLRMKAELVGPHLSFQYQLLDIRDMDGERLLESDQVGDNVIAILARLKDRKAAVRRIVAKAAGLGPAERNAVLAQLMILSGLRQLEDVVKQETSRMPITEDIREHKILGPEFKKATEEGVHQGELTVLRRLIQKRFGPIPSWAEEHLASRSTQELEELSLQLLDAQSLEQLLK